MQLRAEITSAYELTYGRTIQHTTLRALERIVRWLRRCVRHDGLTIRRSMPMIFKGVGWEVQGNVKADRKRYRNNLANRLDMLVEMGWLESWEPVYKDDREGDGIVLVARRDSSAGRAHD